MRQVNFTLIVCLLSSIWFEGVDGAQILVVLPMGSKSHKFAVMPVLEALAERGHQLTVFSAFAEDKQKPNIREVPLEMMTYVRRNNRYDWWRAQQQDGMTELKETMDLLISHKETCYEDLMDNREFRTILKERNVDLVIVDGWMSECVYPFLDELGVPFIFHISSANLPWTQDVIEALGTNTDYASVPTAYADLDDKMTFWERWKNIKITETFRFFRRKLFASLEEYAKKDFPNLRSLYEIRKNVSLVLVNSHPVTDWPRALPPNVIPIGAPHARPAKPLPPSDLKQFVDEAKDGFIVFSLGTIVTGKEMPKETFDTFLRVFARLPQRVVWRWDGPRPTKVPANVMLLDWIPQQDLLGHENTKLIITHGGMLGIQEAIYHGVPFLGWPFAFDQKSNVAMVQRRGFGLRLDWDQVNGDHVYQLIKSITTTQSFKENAVKLSKLMRDQVVPGTQLAVYWVEHVLRHGGTEHLQLASKNMSYFELYLMDFAFVLAFLLICIVLLLCFLIRYCCSIFKSSSVHQKVKNR